MTTAASGSNGIQGYWQPDAPRWLRWRLRWRAIRRWCLRPVESAADLARMLTRETWPLCTGFVVRGHEAYLFLNESEPSGSREDWAVLEMPQWRRSTPRVVDSICFQNLSLDEVQRCIERALAGADDRPIAWVHGLHLDTPEQHGRCPLCRESPTR